MLPDLGLQLTTSFSCFAACGILRHGDELNPEKARGLCLSIVRWWLQAKNEVKVLNSLNHPNIVKYYECYQERNMMHIIMEFCQVCNSSL